MHVLRTHINTFLIIIITNPYVRKDASTLCVNGSVPFSNCVVAIVLRVMLTSAVRHWLRIHFRKVLTSLLWEMKKTIKILITFFSFSIKIFFNQILNQYCTAFINISLVLIRKSWSRIKKCQSQKHHSHQTQRRPYHLPLSQNNYVITVNFQSNMSNQRNDGGPQNAWPKSTSVLPPSRTKFKMETLAESRCVVASSDQGTFL